MTNVAFTHIKKKRPALGFSAECGAFFIFYFCGLTPS